MEILLTSFGASHLPPYRLENTDSFYRMPPLTMSKTYNDFVFDYSILLLFDRVILDAESWDRMSSNNNHRGYDGMKEVVTSLHDAGFVRVVDFDSIIHSKQSLLTKMLDQDLKRLDSWVAPLRESSEAWKGFITSMEDASYIDAAGDDLSALDPMIADHMASYFHHYYNNGGAAITLLSEALRSSTKRRRRQYRDVLRSALVEYLSYVNANLVLSLEMGAPFHDWSDIAPFYREKLLTVRKEDLPEENRVNAIRQLFQVSFPEFTFWDSKSILRILKDKRLTQLRDLIDKSVKGKVTFDQEFASRTLREALGIEQRIGRIRRITSYATLPLGVLPWVGSAAQRGLEELVGAKMERTRRKPLGWFYLITDVVPILSHSSGPDRREDDNTQQKDALEEK